MMKQIIAALSLSLAFGAWADEQAVLNVNLADGSTKTFNVNEAGVFSGAFTNDGASLELQQDGSAISTFNVADITKMSVGKTALALSVIMPDGTQYNYNSLPTLLRETSESIGDPTYFGLGTVTSTTAKGLCDGEFGLYLSFSPSVINKGEFDVASYGSSFKVQLVKYTEGGREWLLESPVSGTISSSLNAKTKAETINIHVLYEDGTELLAAYSGVPTDLAEGSMSDMIPDQVYDNVLLHYNADSVLTTSTTITGYSTTTKKRNGESQIRFTFSTDPQLTYSSSQFYIQVSPTVINEGKMSAPDAPDYSWIFKYGEIELYSNEPHASSADSGYYKNIADNGTFRVDKNEDGTYNIFFDIQFFYNNAANSLTHSGNPSRVIVNFNSANAGK